jgi:hypothetical protein
MFVLTPGTAAMEPGRTAIGTGYRNRFLRAQKLTLPRLIMEPGTLSVHSIITFLPPRERSVEGTKKGGGFSITVKESRQKSKLSLRLNGPFGRSGWFGSSPVRRGVRAEGK